MSELSCDCANPHKRIFPDRSSAEKCGRRHDQVAYHCRCGHWHLASKTSGKRLPSLGVQKEIAQRMLEDWKNDE